MIKNRGFTLIELMIVIVIIGILAGIALPAFQDYMRKSRRADGTAALTGLQIAQEKYRGNCPVYALERHDADSVCDPDPLAPTYAVEYSGTSEEGYYTISIADGADAADGNSYKLIADPVGVQATDTDCDPITLTVSNANPKGLREPAACWK